MMKLMVAFRAFAKTPKYLFTTPIFYAFISKTVPDYF